MKTNLVWSGQAPHAVSIDSVVQTVSSHLHVTTLVVIDSGIPNYTDLVKGIVRKATVVTLDSQQDGVAQLTTTLSTHRELTQLHLVCHGAPGCLYLGNGQLSLENLADYAPQLKSWFTQPNCQLLLYGCHVAAGDAGTEFVTQLQQLTGASIAASTTAIGSAALGGNWELDVATHEMTTALCFQDATLQAYPAVFAAGVLDPSFGAGGIVLGSSGSGSGIGLQLDGKLLVTSAIPNSSSSFTLSRYNSDGSLDTSFGIGGRITGSNNSGEDILIQPDGKIIVAGDTPNSIPGFPTSARSFSITRFNSDGSLDAGFGTGGTSIIHAGSVINDQLSAVLQSDGKILLGGYSFYTGSDSNGLLVRYNSDGSLDTSFGSGGAVFANISNERSYGFSVGLQANGEIVLAGASTPNPLTIPSLALWRFDASGALLNRTKTDFVSATNYQVFAPTNLPQVAVQANGRIVVAQDLYSFALTGASNSAFRASLLGFNRDLTLDSSFGNGGQTVGRYQDSTFNSVPPLYTNFISYSGMTLQGDGSIVVAGQNQQNGVNRLILERYTSNGALDSSFGIGGGVITDLGAGNATAASLVIQPDGKVVATGAANGNFALVRYSGISTTVNQAPTDINLAGRIDIRPVFASTVAPVLSDVGSLSTIDLDTTDSHLYSLVAGAGDTDNAAFRILGGSRLYFVQTFSAQPAPAPQSLKPNYTIRVRSDDGRGGIFEEAITIDANYAPIPTRTGPSVGFSAGAVVGSPFTFSVPANIFYEANIGDTFTINPRLRNGGSLPVWLSFDPTTNVFSGTPSSSDASFLDISLLAVDQRGSSTPSFNAIPFHLNVSGTSPNQAPTDLNLSNGSVAENLASGTTVGTLITTDPNAGNTFSYSLVSGTGSTDNAAFTIVGNALRTAQAFNFESKSSYSIRVRTTDNSGATFEKPLTILVQDVNEAPVVASAIANQTAATGTTFSYVVPASTFTDPDAGDALTLNATLSNGSALPTWLSFNPTTRTFNGTPDTSNVGALNVLVRASDRAGLSTTAGFSLTVNSASSNQAPINLSLSNTSIAENLPSGTVV
ncbi:MAG: DUF4347 domain-containing protein, partial [Leptolyngbyaceae cyanobacterium bins.349]|nr:DUF4347 domain-containing protein [Leptolyngbyaceae cyanobacterium bins.349]